MLENNDRLKRKMIYNIDGNICIVTFNVKDDFDNNNNYLFFI